MFMSNNCPNCKSSDTKLFLELKDYFLSNEEFEIHNCNNCKISFTQPFPAAHEINRYYETDEYLSHDENRKGFIPLLYRTIKSVNIQTKYNQAASELKPGTVLDFGCGIGDFLFKAKSEGWKIHGVEPNDKARKSAAEKLEIDVLDKLGSDNYPDEYFDLITLYHVLEHVYAPKELIEILIKKLKPNGRLVLALPNHNSLDAKIYGKYWAAWDVPRHLWHFNSTSVEMLLEIHNYNLVRRLPMYWDAFYVALLSEKYKNSKMPLLKAFLKGMHSNISALFTGEFSSLVFIFERANK